MSALGKRTARLAALTTLVMFVTPLQAGLANAFAKDGHSHVWPIRALATGSGPDAMAVLSDGLRYVAFEPASGSLRLLDTLTALTTDVALPHDCHAAAIAAGQVVLGCGAGIIDAPSGALRPIAGVRDASVTAAPDEFDAIGAQWLQGTGAAPDGTPGDVFINWHTGERRVLDRHRNVYDVVGPGPPNLDEPALGDLPRCSHQWILARAGKLQIITGVAGQLVLQRCGQSSLRGRVIDSCASGPCDDVTIGGGLATWSSAGRARGLVLRSGRPLSWRLSGFTPRYRGDAVQVAHTACCVVFAVRGRPSPAQPERVRYYEARW